MKTLDLYKERRPYDVILSIGGKKETYKIPTELTVEESERLLEYEIVIKKMTKEEVDEIEANEKVDQYIDFLLDYILILLEHYQPELSKEKLKKMLTKPEVIRIFEFFKTQRFVHLLGLDESPDDSKKKTENAEKQLEVLRQTITFLVMSGFGLLEIRKLYIDEFISFCNATVYMKEKRGELKEGSYDEMKNRGEDEVNSLKKQLFGIDKKKYGK